MRHRKPRALDLFCGAGGVSMGLYQAGFDVTGIDIHSQPHYPFDFLQADALSISLAGYDFIWASPPCQAYSQARNCQGCNKHEYPDLIPATRVLLSTSGVPWVIENVVGSPLISPILICGLALGLQVKRHRLFESNCTLVPTICPPHDQDYFVIFGHEIRNRRHGQAAGRKNGIALGRAAMGINWMNRAELSQAIPPAYSKWIGEQILFEYV